MLQHVATVLLVFQRFPFMPGNSMRHGCDMRATKLKPMTLGNVRARSAPLRNVMLSTEFEYRSVAGPPFPEGPQPSDA